MNKMLKKKSKVVSLNQAVSLIEDNSTLAIGGHTFRRHPMALVYEIIRQKKAGLKLLGWNNANDVDILVGAGNVESVETSYVGMSMFGLATHFRNAVETNRIKVFEHSETTAIDMFRAGSLGLDFMPTKASLGSDVLRTNPRIKEMNCPFTNQKYAAVKAADVDVAIIHGHFADEYGNIGVDQRRLMENEMDALIAKSAKKVIASVEQIVSEDFVKKNAHLTFVPGIYIDAVVEAPYGAHPTACDSRYDYDLTHLEQYHNATKVETDFNRYLDQYVYGCKDHYEYLEKIGLKNLNKIKRPEVILYG
ncbi:CoA transferase subunit A [Alkalihalobacillus oceani]|uniref:CoA transferase subunit A n=1 Tax=Halalkalibacter oceani TaxID=1653776 RepID=UPI00203E25B3|nr:CoA transferase [Halalkalibacter oceani]MCM3759905.1 CoA transferase subunit A [Halalkalibacter oceani]